MAAGLGKGVEIAFGGNSFSDIEEEFVRKLEQRHDCGELIR